MRRRSSLFSDDSLYLRRGSKTSSDGLLDGVSSRRVSQSCILATPLGLNDLPDPSDTETCSMVGAAVALAFGVEADTPTEAFLRNNKVT